MSTRGPEDRRTPESQRGELRSFAMYRMLEAALLALVVFSPAGAMIGEPRHPEIARVAAALYLMVSLGLLLQSRTAARIVPSTLFGVGIDIVLAAVATHALPIAGPGIALMLLFNIGAASLLLRLRLGLGVAAFAAAAMVGEYLWTGFFDESRTRPLAELLMFSVSYLSIATLTNLLGQQMRDTQALADRRGIEAASLAEVNELIIRRMRTGVLLVDNTGQIRLANEAALLLLGDIGDGSRNLSLAAPELAMRLTEWMRSGTHNDTPLRFGAEQAEVLPRFVRMRASHEQGARDSSLVFLDDTSQVSRRAESITLAAMGRFSASLAHEIRNPLAAISYATQLLEESREIAEGDRRLLQIIHQQCMRTNGIVESVLSLARRERATAEQLDLVEFVRNFIDDYRQTMPPDTDTLAATANCDALPALADTKHLHQILTALVQNALRHGRMPGQAARITLHVHEIGGAPVIDVLDRGPGIPDAVAAQLFRPFFTTSEHGTGLGLYIARELCRANEANLDHVPVPGGGSCFRITLPGPHVLLPA